MKTSAKYNKQIEFWIDDQLPDGIGGTYASYRLVFADYANIIPKTEKRGLQEGQLVLVGYYDISIRFRSGVDIDKSTIVKHDNDFYTIQSIINYQDKEYQLVCTSIGKIQEIFEISNPYNPTPPDGDNNRSFTYTFPYNLD